ncbi:MAG: type II secretion system protein F [Fimbriimonadales bacterium]|nr:MAG: type II secretion system protein F [Fimbriimonadales bacterium]GIV07702.1 MAG: type II secretion system protein F [Fimbriimonadales bacterium]
MPLFGYEAVDNKGRTLRGAMEADSEQLVLAKLHEQGLHVVRVEQQREKTKLFSGLGKPKKPKLQAMVVFTRQFATMIDAGIPILRCLDILHTQTKDAALKNALDSVRKDVKSGMALNEAMEKHPLVFSDLFVNMIRAAEVAGILDQILDRLATFLEKDLEVRQKIKSAMMYPVMVLVFSFLVLVAIFMFVLPRFKEIFASMNVEMPAMTQFLFSASDFMIGYWWALAGLAMGVGFTLKAYVRKPKGKYQYDWLKLRFPIFGELVLKLAVARFARTLGVLVSSGVPLMRTLEIVGQTSGNQVLAQAIEGTRQSIREGQPLSAPFAATGLFPAMVIHMMDIGEESGRLSEMMVKIADFYEQEVDATIKGLTSMIEPLLIVFLGGVVGFIAISIMMPMFKLINAIQ